MGEVGSQGGRPAGRLGQVAAVLGSVTLPAWVWTLLNAEGWFVTVAAVVFVAAAGVAVVGWWWPDAAKRETPLAGPDGRPLSVPRLRGWLPAVAAGVAVTDLAAFAAVWLWLWPSFFPTATLIRFEPSDLTPLAGDKVIVHQPQPFDLADGRRVYASRAVLLTVAKPPGTRVKGVRVEAVSLTVEPLTAARAFAVVGADVRDIRLAHQYTADLYPGVAEAVARLTLDGRPVVGTVVLDDERPTADLHVEVSGTNGLYLVGATVMVTDESGRRRMRLNSPERAIVQVYAPEPLKP